MFRSGEGQVELIDLPGTHALSAHSSEEQIAIDVILGRMRDMGEPDGILAVVDATNLYQGLYLAQQLLELGKPVVIALTMADVARKAGTGIDIVQLRERLGGAPVVPVVSTTGEGVAELREQLSKIGELAPPRPAAAWLALSDAARVLIAETGADVRRIDVERLLIDGPTDVNRRTLHALGANGATELGKSQDALFGRDPPLAAEARVRYAWVRDVLRDVQTRGSALDSWRMHLVEFFNRPVPGTIGLFVVMAIVFQAVFAWATPLMDLIDGTAATLGSVLRTTLGDNALSSLIADGVIAGVGSVVIFLPQIMILFLFIILLEDSGYLARAAYLMDRVMRSVGLSGQSIIPMISSFACAVPGIMATRVIPNRRDRFATILAAPFMTCSARLPVYALLIAAFIPARTVGFLNLQGLVLFGLYLFGILMGILTALLMQADGLARAQAPLCTDAAGIPPPQPAHGAHPVVGPRPRVPASRRHGDLHGCDRGLGAGLLSAFRGRSGGHPRRHRIRRCDPLRRSARWRRSQTSRTGRPPGNSSRVTLGVPAKSWNPCLRRSAGTGGWHRR